MKEADKRKILEKKLYDQYRPERIAKWLDGVFEYSQVKWGNVKRGHGDIVIVNPKLREGLATTGIELEPYIQHCWRCSVKMDGRFANVHFDKQAFVDMLKEILDERTP